MGYYIMFENLKQAIFAVESLEQELFYWIKNSKDGLEEYQRILEDNPQDDYSKEQVARYTARVELYDAVMEAAKRFVTKQK